MEIEVVKHLYVYEVIRTKTFSDIFFNKEPESLGKIAYATFNSRERVDIKIMEKVCKDCSIPLDSFYQHFSMIEVEHTMRVVLCKVAKIDELQGMCLPYIIK